MGQTNGQTAKCEHMQRRDQRQSIHMQSTTQPGLCTLIGWWWDGCLFFDDCRHHKLIS